MSETAPASPRPWEYSAFVVTVAAKSRISPSFVRVTLAGDALRRFAPWGLDQRIKVVLPMPDGSSPDFGLRDEPTPHPKHWYTRWKALPEHARNVLRTYTPSAIRPEAGEIDVDFYIHEPAGPASAWALACAPGDELVITGPDIRAGYTGYGIHYTPPVPPRRVLLVGDETAVPAIRNIVTALPSDVAVDVLLELADAADGALPAHAGLHLRPLERSAEPGRALEEAVRAWGAERGRELVDDPSAYAWIAGETGSMARIRRHLVSTVGLDKDRVAFLGYWRLGGPLTA